MKKVIQSSGQIDTDSKLQKLDDLFSQLYTMMSEIVKDRITGGVTFSQLTILRQIALGRDKVSEIAAKQRISPAAVSKMTNCMVQEGYIKRKDDKRDRRLVHLILLKKGREALKANEKIRLEMLMELLNTTTDDEIDYIIGFIETLTVRLKKIHNI